MYEIVNKCGDVCEVLDTSDGVVTSCSVTDLCNLFLNGVFVQGFNYDINQGVFHIDFDDSNYKQSVKNRVERHQVDKSHPYYKMLDNYCFLAKNLYNHANYIHRQDFINGEDYWSYQDLYKHLKSDEDYPDYSNMPTHHTALNVLRRLDKNWKSFFVSIKDYSKNPSKYLGRPKPPKYLSKDGRFVLEIPLENIGSRIINNKLSFNKHFNGFELETHCHEKEGFSGVALVRVVPHKGYLSIEVCYKITRYLKIEKKQSSRIIGIDLGIDNFAAITSNTGMKPVLINGKGLKSINQFYNKMLGKLQTGINMRMTSKISRLTRKRNNKVDDFMHKSSRYIINLCIKNNIDTIVLGYNQGWKQEVNLGKRVNQKFVAIPYYKFIKMLEYKAHDSGIKVIITEESYTSGTSFLDNESPSKGNYNKSRRIHRGLFRSNTGILINADVNASYQIIRKVFGEKFHPIEGIVVCPVRLNVA